VRASPLRAVYGGEQKDVIAVDLLPDRLLVAGTQDGRGFVEVLGLPGLDVLAQLPVDNLYAVYDARFSPDGSRVLAVGDDDRLRVWDLASGALLLTVPAHAAVWSPDGSMIASAGDNLAADVWDVAAGQLHTTVGERSDGIYASVQFAPDGQQIVTTFAYTESTIYTAKVWDIASGEQVTEFAADREVAFSPDGQLLAHGDGATALIREAWSYAPLRPVTSENLQDVYFVRFSPSSQYLATASADGTVRVWRVGREQVTRTQLFRVDPLPALDTFAELVEFSPDERMLVTVDGAQVQVRDLTSGNLLATLRHGERRIHSAQFSPDGRYLVTASDDGSVRVWSGHLDEEWLNLPGEIGHFSPDGAMLATAAGATVRLWDVGSGQPHTAPLENAEPVRDSFFSPDGTRLYAAGNQGVTWWETASGRMAGAWQATAGTLLRTALSADGRRLATVTAAEPQTEDPVDPDRMLFHVESWDASTGAAVAVLHELPAYRWIDGAAFSPDGTLLLVYGSTSVDEGGSNGVVRVADAATGALRYALDFGRSTYAQFSPDGRRLVTVNEDEIAVWQAVDGAPITVIAAGATPLNAELASFSADSTRLAVIDGFSPTARVWELAGGEPLFSLRGHLARLDRIALAPNGALVLTSSAGDGTVRLWDGATGELLSVLQSPAVRYAELSPDGRYVLAVGGGDAKAGLVRFADLMALGQARVTRGLTCTEQRDLLHEAVECVVVTPPPTMD
jgi:WD40 repeat protein